MDRKDLELYSREERIEEAVLIVAALVGLKEIIAPFIPDQDFSFVSSSHLTSAILFIAIICFLFWKESRRKRRFSFVKFPEEPEIFNPFGLKAGNTKQRLWPRSREAAVLAKKLLRQEHSHLIVVGVSGAGKSTLVRQFLIPQLHKVYKNGNKIYVFDNYHSMAMTFISAFSGTSELMHRQKTITNELGQFLSLNTCSVRQVFDPTFDKREAIELAGKLREFLKDAIGKEATLFVFDQVERYFQLMSSRSRIPYAQMNGYDAFFLMEMLSYLRSLTHVRTLFVIRAEIFYDAFAFLKSIANLITPDERATTDSADEVISTYICAGINTTSTPEAISKIREDFRQASPGVDLTREFEAITGLDNREFSNTFMIQLVGFIVENFYEQSGAVQQMLKERRDPSTAVRLLFEFLFETYRAKGTNLVDLELLKIVAFTIALENRITGQSVDLDRLAALTHIPANQALQLVLFFDHYGIVRSEPSSRQRAFRIAHDIIGDHIIESEQFSFDANLRDSIRSLCEAQSSTSRMVPIQRYFNIIADGWKHSNISQAAIWLFVCFGFLKLFSSSFCNFSFDYILKFMPRAQECSIPGGAYFTTICMHLAWLTFIYNIDRNYFSYVLTSKSMRFASHMMAVVGATLAILLSQSPALYVLPVVAGGLMMGALLIIGKWSRTFVGREGTKNHQWGKLTLANMLFTATLTIPSLIVLWREPTAGEFWNNVGQVLQSYIPFSTSIGAATIGTAWIVMINAVMIYFWYHIRPSQQGRVAVASRLAIHDQSRAEIMIP